MELAKIGDRLNAAIEDGDFEGAVALGVEYRRRFEEIWSEMTEEARLSSDMPAHAAQLHLDAAARVAAKRAEAAARLHAMRRIQPYGPQRVAREGWRMTL